MIKSNHERIVVGVLLTVLCLGLWYAATSNTAVTDVQTEAVGDSEVLTQPVQAVAAIDVSDQTVPRASEAKKQVLNEEEYLALIDHIFKLVEKLDDELIPREELDKSLEKLVAYLELDPTLLTLLIDQIAYQRDENLSYSLIGYLHGHLIMSETIEKAFIDFIAESESEQKLWAYQLLSYMDTIGKNLQRSVLEDIYANRYSEEAALATLSLVPNESAGYSDEEKTMIKNLLSEVVIDVNMDYKSVYYSMATLSEWAENDEDLYESVFFIRETKDINLHSAALQSLENVNTDYSKTHLLDYANDSSNPCATRMQAMEALMGMSLDSYEHIEAFEEAKTSACFEEYSEQNNRNKWPEEETAGSVVNVS